MVQTDRNVCLPQVEWERFQLRLYGRKARSLEGTFRLLAPDSNSIHENLLVYVVCRYIYETSNGTAILWGIGYSTRPHGYCAMSTGLLRIINIFSNV